MEELAGLSEPLDEHLSFGGPRASVARESTSLSLLNQITDEEAK